MSLVSANFTTQLYSNKVRAPFCSAPAGAIKYQCRRKTFGRMTVDWNVVFVCHNKFWIFSTLVNFLFNFFWGEGGIVCICLSQERIENKDDEFFFFSIYDVPILRFFSFSFVFQPSPFF